MLAYLGGLKTVLDKRSDQSFDVASFVDELLEE